MPEALIPTAGTHSSCAQQNRPLYIWFEAWGILKNSSVSFRGLCMKEGHSKNTDAGGKLEKQRSSDGSWIFLWTGINLQSLLSKWMGEMMLRWVLSLGLFLKGIILNRTSGTVSAQKGFLKACALGVMSQSLDLERCNALHGIRRRHWCELCELTHSRPDSPKSAAAPTLTCGIMWRNALWLCRIYFSSFLVIWQDLDM